MQIFSTLLPFMTAKSAQISAARGRSEKNINRPNLPKNLEQMFGKVLTKGKSCSIIKIYE